MNESVIRDAESLLSQQIEAGAAGSHNVRAEEDTNESSIWDCQGYSPLVCTESESGAMTMTAMGMRPWGYTDDDDNDDDYWNDEKDEKNESSPLEENMPAVALTTNPSDDTDFRSLADQALKLLELDYQQTLQHSYESRGNSSHSVDLIEPLALCHKEDESTTQVVGEPIISKGNIGGEDDFADFETFGGTLADSETFGGTLEATFLPAAPAKISSDIDSDAVRKAVANLQQNKLSTFSTKYKQWDSLDGNTNSSSQDGLWAASLIVPTSHPCVPKSILQLYSSFSHSAINQQNPMETQQLTRAATLVEALHRCDALQRQECLLVHFIGCDSTEQDNQQIPSFLQPAFQWLPRARLIPRKVEFHIIGPNLSGPTSQRIESSALPAPLESLAIEYHPCLYHEFLENDASENGTPATPDLIISYNSGFWGYQDWHPTLEYLRQGRRLFRKTIPLVVTSYTLWEAHEDYEILKEYAISSIWKPQLNPFGSHTTRPTTTAPPEQTEAYRENAAWQAWRI